MPDTPNIIGARSEAYVLAALLRAGYRVLVPYGVARYDLALDIDGQMHRVQVKTGRIRGGAIVYNIASCSPGTRNKVMRYTPPRRSTASASTVLRLTPATSSRSLTPRARCGSTRHAITSSQR